MAGVSNMSFNIEFDYRFDTGGFFNNQAARDALEAAAAIWEDAIGDEFDNVPVGVDFFVSDPVDGSSERIVLEQEIDDLLIFVGASATPFGISLEGDSKLPEGMCDCPACAGHHGTEGSTVLARAGYSGFGANGDALVARTTSNFRGQGPATDFEPFVGVASFNDTISWNYDVNTTVPGQFDFLTVALHEIGHVLGIGTAPVWDTWIAGGDFTGPNASAANGGPAVPVDGGGAHIAAGHAGNAVLMDPSISSGQRVLPSGIDLGILADIGYEIAGTTKQGTPFEIVSEGDDSPVFGLEVAELIDALGGNDYVVSSTGNDTLFGGSGNDTLFGQGDDDSLLGGAGTDYIGGGTGNDTLDGGTGADTLYGEEGIDRFAVTERGATPFIGDLALASEAILIGNLFGFASPEAVLATATKPFGNVTRLTLDGTTHVDILHASQAGTPLTVANLVLEPTVNQFPTAVPDTATVELGQSVLIDVLANDTDPDDDTLSFLFVSNGQHGTAVIESGQIRYTSGGTATAGGTDIFSYAIDDGFGGQAETTVTVTFTAPPDTDDRIEGTAAGEVLAPNGGGRDTVLGFAGNDTLQGADEDDYMLGGGDDDRLFGEGGADRLEGGFGFDTLLGHDGNDSLTGDRGNGLEGQGDLLYGGSGNDTLHGNGGADTLFGGSGGDSLTGGQGFDQLNGNGGDDSIAGGSEADTLNGEAGADTLDGGSGNDVVNGGADGDLISGGSGGDFIDGGSGNDTATGGLGDDFLLGGGGADHLSGGSGVDAMQGGAGADTLLGEAGNDRLFPGADADEAHGGSGDDIVLGDGGADTLTGGDGQDFVFGGADADDLDGGSGNDVVAGDDGADIVRGGAGNDIVDGGESVDGDSLSGGSGDDALYGRAGDDTLEGDAGSDTLLGGLGADTLSGGADDDTLFGQEANDSLTGDAGNDVLFGNAGADTLSGGADDDTLVGEAGNDDLLGGTGSDTLRGGPDADTLAGGSGDDRLSGEAGADRFEFAAGDGADIVTDFDPVEDTIAFASGGGGPAGPGDLTFGSDGGGSGTITYSGADTVTFTGISRADLETSATILFV